MAIKAIQGRKMPCTMELTNGTPRTNEQNRLQRLWVKEAEEQGDQTAEEYRGYCKLHFGVKLLLNENEKFREAWYRVMKGLTYEQKLEAMMQPLDFPVTRMMTTKQKNQYLDEMYQHFTGQGFKMTDPDEGR